jgi:hypothetical protein
LGALKLYLNPDLSLVVSYFEVIGEIANELHWMPAFDRGQDLGFKNRFGDDAANTALNDVL